MISLIPDDTISRVIIGTGLIFTFLISLKLYSKAELMVQDQPTLPRYLVRKPVYISSMLIFSIVPCAIYIILILVRENIPQIIELVEILKIKINIEKISNINKLPTTVIISCIIIVRLITLNSKINPIIIIRNLIYSATAMPMRAQQLATIAGRHVALDGDTVKEIIEYPIVQSLTKMDFRFSYDTIEFKWALCSYYLFLFDKLERDQIHGIFFSEPSFGWEEIKTAYVQHSVSVKSLKAGALKLSTMQREQAAKGIDALLKKITRLMACFLFYTNHTRAGFWKAAAEFGIDTSNFRSKYYDISIIFKYIVTIAIAAALGNILSNGVYDSIAYGIEKFNHNINNTAFVWATWSVIVYTPPLFCLMMWKYLSQEEADISVEELSRRKIVYFVFGLITAYIVLLTLISISTPPVDDCVPINNSERSLWAFKWSLAPGMLCSYLMWRFDGGVHLRLDTRLNDATPLDRGIMLGACMATVIGLVSLTTDCKLPLAEVPPKLSHLKFLIVATATGFSIGFFSGYVSSVGVISRNFNKMSADWSGDQIDKFLTGNWLLEESYAHGSSKGTVQFGKSNGDDLTGNIERSMKPVRGRNFKVSNNVVVNFQNGRLKFETTSFEVSKLAPKDYEPDTWFGNIENEDKIAGRILDPKHIQGKFTMSRQKM